MINVVTVHWMSDKWIRPQLDYLGRNISEPYRVYASLNGIEDTRLKEAFHFSADLPGRHPDKLNELADIAAAQADPSDVLLFIDGDALPVRPLFPWLSRMLEQAPLVAVRRDENLGDCQPHPCFCATTFRFWKDVDGDWGGAPWVNNAGREVNDAGGKLLHALRDHDADWTPLLRTNTNNPHPLWFGVYGHRIYHHGAGFQVVRAERVDWEERYRNDPNVGRSLRPTAESPNLGLLKQRITEDPGALLRVRPRHVPVLTRAVAKTLRLRREHRFYVRHVESDKGQMLEQLNDDVFARLSRDPDFYKEFDSAEIEETT